MRFRTAWLFLILAFSSVLLSPLAADAQQVGKVYRIGILETVDRKSTRLNSSHIQKSRMPSSA